MRPRGAHGAGSLQQKRCHGSQGGNSDGKSDHRMNAHTQFEGQRHNNNSTVEPRFLPQMCLKFGREVLYTVHETYTCWRLQEVAIVRRKIRYTHHGLAVVYLSVAPHSRPGIAA